MTTALAVLGVVVLALAWALCQYVIWYGTKSRDAVIHRLLTYWEPSHGPDNVGRWWHGVRDQTSVYERMTPGEDGVVRKIERKIEAARQPQETR